MHKFLLFAEDYTEFLGKKETETGGFILSEFLNINEQGSTHRK